MEKAVDGITRTETMVYITMAQKFWMVFLATISVSYMILQSKKMRHASGLTMIEIVPRTYGKRQKRPKVAVP